MQHSSEEAQGGFPVAPFNPFGTHLLESLEGGNSLFLFSFKTKPLHPKGCGEGVQGGDRKAPCITILPRWCS